MSQYRKPMADRFWERVVPEPNSGCYLWQGALDPAGYGHICLGGGKSDPIPAHRAAMIISGFTIPSGMYVLHHCDVRCCVNPDHLYIGTQKDNAADMIKRGRHKSNFHLLKGRPNTDNWNARKTHCMRGHPFSGDNLRINGRWRFCRECAHLRYLARKEKERAGE